MVAKNKKGTTYTMADVEEAERILNVDAVTKTQDFFGIIKGERGENSDPKFINEAYQTETVRLNNILNSNDPNITDSDVEDAKARLDKLDSAYRLLMDHHVHNVAKQTDASLEKASYKREEQEFRYTRDSPDLKTPTEISQEVDREEEKKANSFKGKLSKKWNKITGNEKEEERNKFYESFDRTEKLLREQTARNKAESRSIARGKFKMSAPNNSENTKPDSKNSPKGP
tara:strand:+ start:527 stop:1213 length:687 start_codon:yes stop_codon:yes gene_type:complete